MNDTPKFLLVNPTDNDHCLLLQNDTLDEKLGIRLMIKIVSSVFPSRKNTSEEYQTSEIFIATFNSPVWDPHDEIFGSQEAAMNYYASRLRRPGDALYRRFIATFKLGSYNLTAHFFQAASVFMEMYEMCDTIFA